MYSNDCRRGSFDNLQHGSSFTNNKRPRHIMPAVTGASPQVAKPTARQIWNHARGVLSTSQQSEPRFTDTTPMVPELLWHLPQAVAGDEHTRILEALA